MFKIKRDKADSLFSEYIRNRDRQCVFCGSTQNLTCSHYHSRRNESTRFDTENCDCFCLSCHLKLEHEKGWTEGALNETKIRLPKKYTQWKLKQLGQKRYDALVVRSKTFKKKDRKFQIIRIKEMIKRHIDKLKQAL